jgi:hypothetical protein
MMDLRQIKPLKNRDLQEITHVFFIVKPKLELMNLIATNIHSLLVKFIYLNITLLQFK